MVDGKQRGVSLGEAYDASAMRLASSLWFTRSDEALILDMLASLSPGQYFSYHFLFSLISEFYNTACLILYDLIL